MMATDREGRRLTQGDRVVFTARHMEPPRGSGTIHNFTVDGGMVVAADETHFHTYANCQPCHPTKILLLFGSRSGEFPQVVRK